MIRSMTGFGDAAGEQGGVAYAVEVRALNNRYFKASTRVPDEVAGMEARLEQALRRRVGRGSFVITASLKIEDAASATHIDDTALQNYLDHLEQLRGQLGGQAQAGPVQIDLTALLNLPGVLRPALGTAELQREAEAMCLKLLEQAVDKLQSMRELEGQDLARELETQLTVVVREVAAIAERAPVVIEEYHERLQARVQELMARSSLDVEKPDLLREVAIYADRADIREELTRLEGHVGQFREVISSSGNEPSGRTLDFLTQEMLREANTIGSKSNDREIARRVVELKTAIDRIKEQVQNVE